uniref:Uncharacterized protein n=1 Tax=Onchocerca volvulus TaxID=6282 RepID=A0A8R1TTW2_ONCVO
MRARSTEHLPLDVSHQLFLPSKEVVDFALFGAILSDAKSLSVGFDGAANQEIPVRSSNTPSTVIYVG